MGSGLIPGNRGFTSLRIWTYWMPRCLKISARTLRPAPYMQSMANLKPAFAILSRSAKRVMASTYEGLKSASSILAGVPLGIRLARTLASILAMMAGVADPPYVALNFTPFQLQGLWLEVIITPPAAPRFFTAYESAGVGV